MSRDFYQDLRWCSQCEKNVQVIAGDTGVERTYYCVVCDKITTLFSPEEAEKFSSACGGSRWSSTYREDD